MKKTVLFIINILIFSVLLAQSDNRKIKILVSQKFRYTYFSDAITLSENTENSIYNRYIGKLGFKYLPFANTEFKILLGNESRLWHSPTSKASYFGEVYFDQLYLKYKFKKFPLLITAGRQNIMLGEGFICFDAQPLRGSRSVSFNALRTDFSLLGKSKFTAFISYMPKYDNILPRFNEDIPLMLEENANLGAGLYVSSQVGKLLFSLYYFLKQDYLETFDVKRSTVHTLGTVFKYPLSKKLHFTTELAFQTGFFDKKNIIADGMLAHFDYNFGNNVPLAKDLTVGGFFMSGDNPSTERYEAWNPLWGRWPKWSNSYIYTFIKENSVAYWSNIYSVYTNLTVKITKKSNAKLTYYHLQAQHHNNTELCSGTGLNRGDLLIFTYRHKIFTYLNAELIYEKFFPANFYSPAAQNYDWFRLQLAFTW